MEVCNIINKRIVFVLLILTFISCDSEKEASSEDETIRYARQWKLPDSIFMQSSFYAIMYESYVEYCQRMNTFEEVCFEKNNRGIRLGFSPKKVGINGDLNLYSLEELDNGFRLKLKKISLKDNSPIFPNDTTFVAADSIIIETVCSVVLKEKGILDDFYQILKKHDYFNIPPLDITPGVKPIGFSGLFDIEFKNESGYHRIHRTFNCDKNCLAMYNEIIMLFHKKMYTNC